MELAAKRLELSEVNRRLPINRSKYFLAAIAVSCHNHAQFCALQKPC